MFVFAIAEKGKVIETVPVAMAKSEDEAGQIASMGLADYPRTCEITLENRNGK